MNPNTKYIVFLVFILILIGCDDPIPIEISNEIEEEAEISILNTEPSSYVITGYDSTGIVEERPKLVSLINFNGIKNTFDKVTYYKAFAEAVFLDITKPVFSNSNRLVGYNTFDVNSVKFNNQLAVKSPFYISFRENTIHRDTLVGNRHAILYKTVLLPERLNFRYDSQLSVVIESLQGNVSTLNLKVPREIVGNVSVTGKRGLRNLRIFLSWNKAGNQNTGSGLITEEIIIGGKYIDRDELIPLLRLSKIRRNIFEIPNSLVEDILSSDKFEYIVFTFLRKIITENSLNQLGDIRFASQSIHNVWIKL